MTLPASFPLSMSQVATELGLSLPLSMNHAWVLALAGQSALPANFSQLLGQNGKFSGVIGGTQFNNGPTHGVNNLAINFARGTIAAFLNVNGTIELNFSVAPPSLTAKIFVQDNTTGGSILLSKADSTDWTAPASSISGTINITSTTENYTFTLHT